MRGSGIAGRIALVTGAGGGIVAIAPWAFVGFDNVPQAAEEFDFPPAKAFALIVFAIVAAAAQFGNCAFVRALAHMPAAQTAGIYGGDEV